MFSVSRFKSNFTPVRPNLFFAEVDFPSFIRTAVANKESTLQGSAMLGGSKRPWFNSMASDNINNTFRFRCEATELPGRTVSTSDDQAYGPTTKYAYETSYADITMQIMCSEDMRERMMFEIWIENIINQTNLTAGNSSLAGLSKYYDNYASGSVRIYQVSDSKKQLARYTLYNAYPIQISPMNLTWEEQNTYQRFSITMTYRYHVVDFNSGVIRALD